MNDVVGWSQDRIDGLGPWLGWLVTLALAIGAALLIHWIAVRLLRGAVARTRSRVDDVLLARAIAPGRWVMIAIAAGFAQRTFPLDGRPEALWRQLLGFLLPALLGWLALSLLRAFQDVVELRADISVEDNLRARRRRTRVAILGRIGSFAILFVTICLMLLSVPSIRNVGITLMASAGLAGLAVGAAAQPALKNLIAGIQMAFTEPIRIDDVVIVAGEWGRVEDIRLTYVVVKVWDERRLIVPVAKFLEDSFQNWTRQSAQLLGSVFWYLDPEADIPRLRAKMGELVEGNPRWDRRFWNMQVTDMKDQVIEVRGLMTAKDAAIAFDLRCDVREGLLAFIRDEMPEALPKRRLAGEIAATGRAAPDGNLDPRRRPPG